MRRLSLRKRLTIAVTAAAAMSLVVLTAGFNLLLRSNLNADANRVLKAGTSAALEEVSIRGGSIQVKESPDRSAPDAQLWVYSGSRVVEGPRGPASVQRLAATLSHGSETRAEDPASDTRLFAVPVVERGRRLGTIVAGLSLHPYEHSASRALFASLIYAAAALLLIVVATQSVVNRALRPVARMTAEAADWSEHDLEHRFNVGEPRDELTRLAATFDGMLERLASSLRHEQLLSAELSHELRTPLAAIAAEAQLALRRDRGDDEYRSALRSIGSRAAQMQGTLETLLAAARAESRQDMGTAGAAEVTQRAIDACEDIARESGVELRLTPPAAPLRVDVGADTASRILAPLIENGCRYGRTRVGVSVLSGEGAVEFVVSDDGPGVSPEEADSIFQPGFRGQAGSSADDGGAGLGLALARRLARAVGGEVEALASRSGASFRARIPVARPR